MPPQMQPACHPNATLMPPQMLPIEGGIWVKTMAFEVGIWVKRVHFEGGIWVLTMAFEGGI